MKYNNSPMKKYCLLLVLGVISMFFVSCSDDESDGGIELRSYLDGNYSPNSEDYLLAATIDGEKVSENASVTFHAGDFKTGSMILTNLLDGYDSVEISKLALTEITEDDYKRLTFSGSQKVDDTFSFSYSGYIVYGTLHLELSTIR